MEKFEENRKRPLSIGHAQKAEIEQNFDFMWGQVELEELSPSKIDTRILATALTLGIRVVTDDQGMLELAKAYGVDTWTTLELLKSMFDAKLNALSELNNATGFTNAQIFAWNEKSADSAIATLQDNDWQDLSMRKGNIQNYDIGMSGGNDRTTFYLGANYTYQSTIFDKVDFKRYGLSTNISNKINDKVTVGLKLNLSTFEQKVPFATDGSFLGNPAFSAATILNVNKLYNDDGTYFGLPGNSQALAGALNQNIVAVNDYNQGLQRTNQMVGGLNLDYKILPWLTYRGFGSLDYRLVQGSQYRDPRTNDGFAVKGRATTESNTVTNFLTTHTLNAEHNFGKVKLDGLIGYEYRRDINEQTFARSIGFPSPYFTTLDAGATPEAAGQSWTGFKRSSG
ncbi:MAG: hypothetical protein EOP50_16600, partial [Sphingobacteriales bacterium]